jgi:hypothetical protein
MSVALSSTATSSVVVTFLQLASGDHRLFLGLVVGPNRWQVWILHQETRHQYDRSVADGRLTAKDPIGLHCSEGATFGKETNLYDYVLQDPINKIDPTGLFELTQQMVAFMGFSILAAITILVVSQIKISLGCRPCDPPVGTLGYLEHSGPDSDPHQGVRDHYHLYRVNQSPPPMCRCFWAEIKPKRAAWGTAVKIEDFRNLVI